MEIGATFNLINSTLSVEDAFTLGIGIGSTITVVISQNGPSLIVQPTAGDWSVTVDLVRYVSMTSAHFLQTVLN